MTEKRPKSGLQSLTAKNISHLNQIWAYHQVKLFSDTSISVAYFVIYRIYRGILIVRPKRIPT